MSYKPHLALALMLGNLAAALALYPKAIDAPQSYLGDFTSVAPAATGLFFGAILPTALVGSGLDRVGVLRRAVSWVVLATIMVATAGVYLAVRVLMAQPTLTVGDWLLLGLATPVYLLTASAMNLAVIKQWLPHG